MATKTTTAATKSVNLGVKIDSKAVFATPTGLKIGSTGKVIPAGDLYGTLNKGTRRALRKSLHNIGRVNDAAAPAVSVA